MQNKVFDFVGKLKISLCISIGIILIGVIMNAVFGTQLDINFKGGTTITYSYSGTIDMDKVKDTASKALNTNVKISESEDYASDAKSVVITVVGNTSITTEQLDALKSAMSKHFADNDLGFPSVTSVDAPIGISFLQKSLFAMLIASLLVVLYVGIRFRNIGGVSAALMALVALVHDVVIAYFVYVILQIPLNDNFIAVILTILGYSLNDTIVIYDRIRENTKRFSGDLSHREIVNLSVSQSFRRTMITSLTTFTAITTISVVAGIRGLTSILSFSIPMSIGIIAGFFSSTFLSGSLWVKWLEHKDKRDAAKKAQGKSKSRKPTAKKAK